MDSTTHIFSLYGTDADEILRHEKRGPELECFRARSIGPRELSRLAEVLDLAGYETAIQYFSLLAGESQEPPWVISIPESLTRKITAMDATEATEVASIWARTSELSGAFHAHDLHTYLDDLRAFMGRNNGPFVLFVKLD